MKSRGVSMHKELRKPPERQAISIFKLSYPSGRFYCRRTKRLVKLIIVFGFDFESGCGFN